MNNYDDLRVDVSEVADILMTHYHEYGDLRLTWNNVIFEFIKDQVSFDEVYEYIEQKVKLGELWRGMEGILLKKYPVTSNNGNKYFVEIKKWIDSIDHSYSSIDVTIYKKNSWYSKKLTTLYFKNYKSNTQEYYDFVLATESTVIAYEASCSYLLNKEDVINEKKFKEWNGILR